MRIILMAAIQKQQLETSLSLQFFSENFYCSHLWASLQAFLHLWIQPKIAKLQKWFIQFEKNINLAWNTSLGFCWYLGPIVRGNSLKWNHFLKFTSSQVLHWFDSWSQIFSLKNGCWDFKKFLRRPLFAILHRLFCDRRSKLIKSNKLYYSVSA